MRVRELIALSCVVWSAAGCLRTVEECATSQDCDQGEVCTAQAVCEERAAGDAAGGVDGGGDVGVDVGDAEVDAGCCAGAPAPGVIVAGEGESIVAAPDTVAVAASERGEVWVAFVDEGGALGSLHYDGGRWERALTGESGCRAPVSMTMSDGAPILMAKCAQGLLRLSWDGGGFAAQGAPALLGEVWAEVFPSFNGGDARVVYSSTVNGSASLGLLGFPTTDAGAARFQIPQELVSHVDVAVEGGTLYATYVADGVAYAVFWSRELGWKGPRQVALVGDPTGAAVDVDERGVAYVFTLDLAEGSPTTITRRSVAPVASALSIGEPERVTPGGSNMGAAARLRGLRGVGVGFGVRWQAAGDGEDRLYDDAGAGWRRRDVGSACAREDNEPSSLWYAGGAVYVARRDAQGRVCFAYAE